MFTGGIFIDKINKHMIEIYPVSQLSVAAIIHGFINLIIVIASLFYMLLSLKGVFTVLIKKKPKDGYRQIKNGLIGIVIAYIVFIIYKFLGTFYGI